MPEDKWLNWSRQLMTIVQAGLTYSENPYDIERYHQLQRINAEMLAAHSDGELAKMQGILRAEKGYATPKVDVRGVIFSAEDEILLVRERSDGKWTLPGGWADVNETPAECVAKEVREESGYEVSVQKLLAVWDKSKHRHPPSLFYTYKLFFRCEIVGGAPAESLETSGVAFFREGDYPPLSQDRTTVNQLERLYEHYRQPDLPTDFD